MLRIRVLFVVLMGGITFLEATSSSVLARIGDKKLSLEEYLYRYRYYQNTGGAKILPETFLQQLVLEKMKAQDARIRGLVDAETLKRACLRLTDSVAKDKTVTQEVYPATTPYVDNRYFKYELLTIRLPQHATSEQSREAKRLIDEVQQQLHGGKSLVDVQIQSQTGLAIQKKKMLTWESNLKLLTEAIRQLDQLNQGAWSVAFTSPWGWQLIRKIDEITHSQFVINQLDRCRQKDEYLSEMLADAILAASWDWVEETHWGHPSEEDLSHYFDKHKKRYRWNFPHFEGGILVCPDKKVGKRLKKQLKRIPAEQWNDFLTAYNRQDTLHQVKWVSGLFELGRNAWVDFTVFKQGEQPDEFREQYVTRIGKELKKGPGRFGLIREQVLADYQKDNELRTLAVLRKKMKVEINEDILKTVNSGGYN